MVVGLSDQNLVTNLQYYKDRQNKSSLFSISMEVAEVYTLVSNQRPSVSDLENA